MTHKASICFFIEEFWIMVHVECRLNRRLWLSSVFLLNWTVWKIGHTEPYLLSSYCYSRRREYGFYEIHIFLLNPTSMFRTLPTSREEVRDVSLKICRSCCCLSKVFFWSLCCASLSAPLILIEKKCWSIRHWLVFFRREQVVILYLGQLNQDEMV